MAAGIPAALLLPGVRKRAAARQAEADPRRRAEFLAGAGPRTGGEPVHKSEAAGNPPFEIGQNSAIVMQPSMVHEGSIMQRYKQTTMFSARRNDLRDHSRFSAENDYTLYSGPCEELFGQIKGRQAQLFVTSPPYNIGKRYEKRTTLAEYLADQERVIEQCIDRLSESGSICWQVGNHIQDGAIVPLDIALYPLFIKHGLVLRNRIVWHFEHGLHCSRRLSGRHETILWFTWPRNDYVFDLNPIRVPQKYPGKRYYKGPKAGQYSANPLGKNPGDVWVIPNVKHNHVEKTTHPCQFPVELVERLVLALTRPGDLVVDPYIGSGSTAVAALLHKRRVAGSDIIPEFVRIAELRIDEALNGCARTRPRGREVYKPQGRLTESPFTA